MNSNQREVARWWHSGRDYMQGVMLLGMFSKNKVLVHTLMKQAEKYGRGKLDYELPKAVDLDWKKMPKASAIADNKEQLPFSSSPLSKGVPEERGGGIRYGQEENPPLIPPFPKGDEEPAAVTLSGVEGQQYTTEYPPVIRRLKYEYSELYAKRSMLHKQMGDVPADNSTGNMQRRAELLQQIKAITSKMDYLYPFEQAFIEKGIVPVEEQIWPPEKQAEEMPADAEGLKKLKKNLQTYNTKARNVLMYQEKTKTEHEHPMPKGPKRQRIEIAIKRREELIEEIDRRLFELEVGGN